MAKVTAQMLADLFEKGVVIHRAWIMPDRMWEYTVLPVGKITGHNYDIATKNSLSSAYRAALDYLSAQQRAQTDGAKTHVNGDGLVYCNICGSMLGVVPPRP